MLTRRLCFIQLEFTLAVNNSGLDSLIDVLSNQSEFVFRGVYLQYAFLSDMTVQR